MQWNNRFTYFLLVLSLPCIISTRNTIPLNDINVLVLTDVHSWVGGHGPNEPTLDINYGHVVSFYERFREYCDTRNKDLYFVMNGDWVDGTGISLNGDVSALTQVLEKMPWDAVNVGNHELYHENLIEQITEPGGFVDWFGTRYLSSNIVRTSSNEPLGNRYVVMQGKRSAVLTFGFLYNMKDHVGVVDVKEVESVVEEQWFLDALHNENYDAILVLAHMNVQDPLVTVILNQIREQIGTDMPVQFVTGHTHIRSYAVLDNMSTSFEAGRYLDTLGFVSFPTKENAFIETNQTNHSSLFAHNFIDANQESLKAVLRVESLDTENGMELSKFIETIRDEMGLTQEIGCVNQSYFTTSPIYDPSSLWGFFIRNVAPATVPSKHVFLFEKGDLRYDLLARNVRFDDIIAVSPFNDTLYSWKDVPGDIILQLNATMNVKQEKSFLPLLPLYILAPTEEHISENDSYVLISSEFDTPTIREALALVYPESIQMEPQPMNLTSTALWLNYFRQHSSCETAKTPAFHKNKHDKDLSPPLKKTSNNTSTHTDSPDTTKEDEARLWFVAAALAAMIVLGSINIWQRSRQFTQLMSVKRAIILDAQNDFIGTDEVLCNDRDDEESEGLFI